MRRLALASSVVLSMLLAAAGVRPLAASMRIKPTGSQIDLLLVGYAVFHTNLAETSRGYFDSSDQLPAEFTNRQVVNVRLDGQLGKGLALDARLLHDREGLRDWRYLARLTAGKSTLAVGELDGAFRETQFTRYDTPFYGLEGRLGLKGFTASAFATTREGNYRVDRLRGTNLSGPFILSASPVLEGSERIALEVRDRRDEERILSSDAKLRGRDYTIDYPTGTILFDEPIESETFDGDPIVIVVEYQHETRGAGGSSWLGGARLEAEPWKGLRIGSTWLKASSGSSGALGRQGLVGFDQTLALGKWLSLEGELSGPVGDPLDRREGALRLGLTLKPLAGLTVSARLRRVGDRFEIAANPRLATELDRQDWEIDTSFVPSPRHRFSAGYGQKSDDVAGDPAVIATRTRSWFAAWEARFHRLPLLRLRFESRETTGPGTFGSGSLLHSLSLDAEDKLGRLGFLGDGAIKGQYRYESLQEDGRPEANRVSHSLKLRLDFKPAAGLDGWVEGRELRTSGQGDSPLASQTHDLSGGLRLKLGKKLSTGLTLRWRANVDGRASGGGSTRTTSAVDLRWEPSERLRLGLKYEITLLASGSAADQRTQNLFAQLAVKPFSGLTLALGSKLDDRGESLGGGSQGLDGEYFASLLYKGGERLTIFARYAQGLSEERLPPFAATRSARRTALAGMSLDLGRGWGTLGEIKDERLEGAAFAHRRAIVLELNRLLFKQLTLAGGVEITLDEQGEVSRLDRERVYLKLVGRL